jgi:SAM-dependent methyltransferase
MQAPIIDQIAGQSFVRTEQAGCPICGNGHPSRAIPVQFGAVAHVAVCRQDRLAYQTPRPSPEATLAYMNWRWRSRDPYVDRLDAQLARAARRLAFVHSCEPKRGALLDFGAGAGAFVKSALDAGWQAEGVDRSDAARAKAQDRLGVTLHAEIPSREYDVITLWDVVEHLRAPGDILAMLRHHLKPGGLIVIETANWESWPRLAAGRKWRFYLFDHQFYFSPAALGQLVSQAGYDGFRVLNVNRSAPPGLAGLRTRPRKTLRAWAHYAAAMLRWPGHGNISTLIGVARRPAGG